MPKYQLHYGAIFLRTPARLFRRGPQCILSPVGRGRLLRDPLLRSLTVLIALSLQAHHLVLLKQRRNQPRPLLLRRYLLRAESRPKLVLRRCGPDHLALGPPGLRPAELEERSWRSSWS